ncbi:hypothetical protein HPB51_023855 [Rhipicephalus microplus]|uniref:Monocarboxylate transporter n=1 Tax=Rhipicephalus microplus TaxID=6941 RepID=A0A9J6F8Q2_RHIMP|nr:hypothetical protein HPB51_023855 [Rhipicephalus microplus]
MVPCLASSHYSGSAQGLGRVSWCPQTWWSCIATLTSTGPRRAGVSFAGAALSSILLPPLIGRLLDKYGLQGTMLIVGALVLNALAGSIAVRSTPSFPRPPHHPLFSTTLGTTPATSRCSSCDNSASKNPVTDFFSTDLLAVAERHYRFWAATALV